MRELDAVHVRQRKRSRHEIDDAALELALRGFAGFARKHDAFGQLGLQHALDHAPDELRAVDDEHARRVARKMLRQ